MQGKSSPNREITNRIRLNDVSIIPHPPLASHKIDRTPKQKIPLALKNILIASMSNVRSYKDKIIDEYENKIGYRDTKLSKEDGDC
jgi:hypothetical protein